MVHLDDVATKRHVLWYIDAPPKQQETLFSIPLGEISLKAWRSKILNLLESLGNYLVLVGAGAYATEDGCVRYDRSVASLIHCDFKL